jgi:hypothetical protein
MAPGPSAYGAATDGVGDFGLCDFRPKDCFCCVAVVLVRPEALDDTDMASRRSARLLTAAGG